MSTLAGELDSNGQRKLPLALTLAGVLMFFSYVGPLVVGNATMDSPNDDWEGLELQEDVDNVLRIHIVASGRHGKLWETLQNIQGATKMLISR